ncbi:MAG: sigma-70 family RNA polymerase sigma factor [Gammaproteobacteria bacterium]|nr:sigma-70 family RNA polymerase sigma factor [Gammaproteobacteria bacterium]
MAAATTQQQQARDEGDRRLLARVAGGDREAFRELYIVYHRRLARFLTRLTRRYEIAEEIINDTLWVVWRKAGDFRGDSRVSTWIMGIAYRRALKALRARSHALAEAVPIENEPLVAPDELGAAETSEWILLAMRHLPTEQRLALEFAYGYGHSCEEIALIMACPVNTVKTRLFHARAKLRDLLPGLAGGGGEASSGANT